jgi:hypothetical protein
MSDAFAELHKQHQASQDKYTYFLLAAAGACIAFATEKSAGVPLSWPLLLVALAVASWAVSFYCGCKCANTVQALTMANASLLSLNEGTHEHQPQEPEIRAAAIRGVQSAIDGNLKRASHFNEWQFRLFALGGVLFVAWRIFEVLRLAP